MNEATQRPWSRDKYGYMIANGKNLYVAHGVTVPSGERHPRNAEALANEELEAKLENARRISGDNADLAMRCRNVLQALLDRHNGGGDPLAITILSPADVTEIKAALDWRVY